MHRRQVLQAVSVTLGLGFGVSGSTSASSSLVSVQDFKETPGFEAYYTGSEVPQNHLDRFQETHDILYATDASDLDCDFDLSFTAYPPDFNGKRDVKDWGSESGVVVSQDRLLNLNSPVASIELTSSGLRAEYKEGGSGVVADVNNVEGWPIREVYYESPHVPASHLDGFRRQVMDVISVTDIRNRDNEEGLIRVAVTPSHRNTKRTRGVWGVEQSDGSLVLSEEGQLVDVTADVSAIEITDSAVKVEYES